MNHGYNGVTSKPFIDGNPESSQEYSLDEVVKIIQTTILDNIDNEYKLVIATDSQRHRKKLHYIPIVILYNVGHGGRMWRTMIKIDTTKSSVNEMISKKILYETELSLDIANYLYDNGINVVFDRNEIQVHVDAGYKGGSVVVVDSCRGWVEGSRYECKIKPSAWGSSYCADKYSK